jgi:hypothetical protein
MAASALTIGTMVHPDSSGSAHLKIVMSRIRHEASATKPRLAPTRKALLVSWEGIILAKFHYWAQSVQIN